MGGRRGGGVGRVGWGGEGGVGVGRGGWGEGEEGGGKTSPGEDTR